LIKKVLNGLYPVVKVESILVNQYNMSTFNMDEMKECLQELEEPKQEEKVSDRRLPDIIEQLIPVLTSHIRKYHEMFTQPLIAELWEETLHNAFVDCGHNTTWKPNRSHKVGEDMRVGNIENSRISCKSGQFIKPRGGVDSVKFNGSRTTSQKSLQDKIDHLSGDHDDWYFLLAKKKPFDKTYKLLIFESTKCKVNKLTWKENDSGKQFIGTGTFQASINKSMSSQLWTTLPMSMVTYEHDITV
jgi:hypothetical protein